MVNLFQKFLLITLILQHILLPKFGWTTTISQSIGCVNSLSAGIEISNSSGSMILAENRDVVSHRKTIPTESPWSNLATKYGFGPELENLKLTNIPILRDGTYLGTLGLTKNGKAILISELMDKQLSQGQVKNRYFLDWQKKLIESGAMRPILGWLSKSGRLFVAREIIVGWSIQRLRKHKVGFKSIISDRPDLLLSEYSFGYSVPSIKIEHIKGIERILSQKLDVDSNGHQLTMLPLRLLPNLFDLQEGNDPSEVDLKSLIELNNPVSPEAISNFVSEVNWVIDPQGGVMVDGLNQIFSQSSSNLTEQDIDVWNKRNGIETQLVDLRESGEMVPNYATWFRFWLGLHLNQPLQYSYLKMLLENDPSAIYRLNVLQAGLIESQHKEFNSSLVPRNLIMSALFGGHDRLEELINKRIIGLFLEYPGPRPTELKFASSSKKRNHARHIKEFGLNSVDEYIKYANQKILSPPGLKDPRRYVQRSNGDILVWNPVEEWLGIFNPTGILKTFYKLDPDFRRNYFNKPHYPNELEFFIEVFIAVGKLDDPKK